MKTELLLYLKNNFLDRRQIVGRIIFASVYLSLIYWFKRVDIWNNYFSERSSLYVFYNIFRFLFIIYIVWMHYYIGNVLLVYLTKKLKEFQLNFIDSFLLSSCIGVSLTIIVMFSLGILHLYYLPIIIALTTPIVFISFPAFNSSQKNVFQHFKDSCRKLNHPFSRKKLFTIPLILIILAQTIFLFISKGLLPQLTGNDSVVSYMPYFQRVISNHGLLPNIYFQHHFITKGAGLHFLLVLLSDVHSIQLTSFYLFSLTAILLFNFIKKIFKDNLNIALISVIIYLCSGITLYGFQKIHIAIGSFFIFIVYITILLPMFPPISWRISSIFVGLILVSLTIMSPESLLFTLPILSYQIVYYRISKNNALSKYMLVSLGVAIITCSLILIYNYYTFGLFQQIPANIFYPLRNESILYKRVHHSLFMYLNELFPVGESTISVSYIINKIRTIGLSNLILNNSVIPFHTLILLLIGLVIVIISFKKAENREILRYIVPILFLIFYVFFLKLWVKANSFDRYTSFIFFFYISAGFAFLKYIQNVLKSYLKANHSYNIILIIALVGASYFLINFYSRVRHKNDYEFNIDCFSFITGKISYSDFYNKKWDHRDALEIQRFLGYDKKVFLLNFKPLFYGIPRSRFVQSFLAEYIRKFDIVAFGSPEESMEVMKEYDINYFYIDLEEKFLLFLADTQLFRPSSIKKYFKIIWQTENSFLLTWKNIEDPAIDDSFIRRYKIFLEQCSNSMWIQAYRRLRAKNT